jgi:anti-anti-sigma factor
MQRPNIASKHVDGALWLVRLEGEHDLTTAPDLRHMLDQIFETGTCIVIDLSAATFIDSSILGELLRANVRAQVSPDEKVAIVAPTGCAAARLFAAVDAIHTCFTTYESTDAAMASCGGAAVQTA